MRIQTQKEMSIEACYRDIYAQKETSTLEQRRQQLKRDVNTRKETYCGAHPSAAAHCASNFKKKREKRPVEKTKNVLESQHSKRDVNTRKETSTLEKRRQHSKRDLLWSASECSSTLRI